MTTIKASTNYVSYTTSMLYSCVALGLSAAKKCQTTNLLQNGSSLVPSIHLNHCAHLSIYPYYSLSTFISFHVLLPYSLHLSILLFPSPIWILIAAFLSTVSLLSVTSTTLLCHFDQFGSHGSWAISKCGKVMGVMMILVNCQNHWINHK